MSKTQPLPLTAANQALIAEYCSDEDVLDNIYLEDDAALLGGIVEMGSSSGKGFVPKDKTVAACVARLRVLTRLQEIADTREDLTDEKRDLTR